MSHLEREGRRPYILGGGSNTVLADGELNTPIVCTKHMRGLTFEGSVAHFEAGVTVAGLMREARARSLGGLEFLEGVPATLGGALRMNAGAFGCQMSDFAISVEVLSKSADVWTIERRIPQFAYRRGEQGVILGGSLKLLPMSSEDSLSLRAEFLARRRAKQPGQPSCGSVFKNVIMREEETYMRGLTAFATPVADSPINESSMGKSVTDGKKNESSIENAVADSPKSAMCVEKTVVLPAGRLIDACGLKGVRKGGAMISDLHANFIVNLGGATAGDFLSLADLAEQAVYEKFSIRLAREFVLLK